MAWKITFDEFLTKIKPILQNLWDKSTSDEEISESNILNILAENDIKIDDELLLDDIIIKIKYDRKDEDKSEPLEFEDDPVVEKKQEGDEVYYMISTKKWMAWNFENFSEFFKPVIEEIYFSQICEIVRKVTENKDVIIEIVNNNGDVLGQITVDDFEVKVYPELENNWIEYINTENDITEGFFITKSGTKCYFHGWLVVGDSNQICTLPESVRPEHSKEIMVLTDKGVDTILIKKTGEIIYSAKLEGVTKLNLASTYYML